MLHSKLLQKSLNVGRLTDPNTPACLVLHNLHAKEVMVFPQIFDVES